MTTESWFDSWHGQRIVHRVQPVADETRVQPVADETGMDDYG